MYFKTFGVKKNAKNFKKIPLFLYIPIEEGNLKNVQQ